MFRRDPLNDALAQVAGVLGVPGGMVRPLRSLARTALRQGGVLAAARGAQQVVVGLGGVPGPGVFELASVSKPFTAALAGELVRAGALDWEVPLAALGGPLRRLPASLTARRLATHTAGLPMHPARVAVTTFTRFNDPYGGMTAEEVLGSARRWARPAGALSRPRFGYSNLGVGVLALALAHASGETLSAAGYGRALHRFVTGPLDLQVALHPPGAWVVTPAGLLGGTQPTTFGPLAGAGGLYGHAQDLLTFGQAHLKGQLGPHWQDVGHPAGLPAHLSGVAPGWFQSRDVWWHDGVARGTRTALGFHPPSGAVLAVLARGAVPVIGTRGAVPLLLLELLRHAGAG